MTVENTRDDGIKGVTQVVQVPQQQPVQQSENIQQTPTDASADNSMVLQRREQEEWQEKQNQLQREQQQERQQQRQQQEQQLRLQQQRREDGDRQLEAERPVAVDTMVRPEETQQSEGQGGHQPIRKRR